jgi:peptidoglycan hydrolase CwlO-like protein
MKKISRVLTGIAVITMFAGLINPVNVHADSVSDAKSAISSKKDISSQLVNQINDQTNKLNELNKQVVAKQSQLDSTEEAIDTAQQRINELSGKIADTQVQITQRKDNLKKQLVALQKQNSDTVTGNIYIDFILKSDNLSDLISRSFTVNKISGATKDALTAVQDAQKQLADLKSEQEQKENQLQSQKQQIVQDQNDLKAAQKAAQDQQNKLQQELNDNKSALAGLQSQLTQALAAQKAQQEALAAKQQQQTASANSSAATVNTSTANTNTSSNSASSSVGMRVMKISFYDPAVLGSSMGYGGVAAALSIYPKGTRLKIVFADGTTIHRVVNDTGTFAYSNPNQLDVAWPNASVPSYGVTTAVVTVE